MKLAIVGKGGSGKSTISWLMAKTLADMEHRVLAIDADHNMDLTSNLGLDYETLPQMQKTDKEFFEAVGYEEGKPYTSILDNENIPSFFMHPKDAYTASITTSIAENISLINVGLGDPDVMHRGKCAHGLSGPLKYYLGFLDEGNDWVVIDSVAGVDMINYGLYSGVDAILVVVEPHRNSIKVMEQIVDLCRKTMTPCYIVVNKPVRNEFYRFIADTYKEKIIGEVPVDAGFTHYDYSKLAEATKEKAKAIVTTISAFKKRGSLHAMRAFHTIKNSDI